MKEREKNGRGEKEKVSVNMMEREERREEGVNGEEKEGE